MTLNPVSLFRLTTLATSSSLRLALPTATGAGLWVAVSVGWLIWLALPFLAGLYRFERADIS